MKIKKIFVVAALVAAVVCVASCRKVRYCHCVTTEGAADTTVVVVDRGMKCDRLVELGVQSLQDGEWQTSTQKVSCIEIDEDTVATIPARPTED